MNTLCEGLRRTGADAVGFNWFQSYLDYPGSAVFQTDAYEMMGLLDYVRRKECLFHFHNGNSLMVNNEDLPLLDAAGYPMVMHHWGSDVRSASLSRKLNPYPLPAGYLTDQEIHERLKRLSASISHAIVQDAELYPHVKDYYRHVHILPLAVDVRRYRPNYPRADMQRLRIVHAPTRPAFKGTSYVEAAIADLKRKHPVEYVRIQNMSHQEAIRLYAEADLIIDQLLCGTYGMLAVEAMAMGKPVVAYIREDVRRSLPPSLPIIQAAPETILAVLKQIASQPEQLRHIGKASRDYVRQRHDVSAVIPQLLAIYKQL
ncbi:hypothetical protein XYCOK13_13490 [Xylanibacillus composti]|uniref:Glycosyltransferase involved in cell wall biosynthesis n=2 Tax=Xylanibacillus composti TaxID=1572762 RepID=A0A8J4M1X4_9BACL|nr:hypothetical protein XYCOK13_13490 [Xylanibacillus composti]